MEPVSDQHSSSSGLDDRSRFRFSFRELILWTVIISVLMALPTWFGEYAVLITFYTTIPLISWRLSKMINVLFACTIGVMVAVAITALMVVLGQTL